MLNFRKATAFCLSIILAAGVFGNIGTQVVCKAETEADETAVATAKEGSYGAYYQQYGNTENAESEIVLSASDFSVVKGENVKFSSVEGVENALVTDGNDCEMLCRFTAPETALYEIHIRYYQIKGRNSAISLGVKLDGEYPFSETKSNRFDRIWQDDSGILTDEYGDQYTPSVSEAPQWTDGSFKDRDGYYGNNSYRFYLTAGEHTLSLVSDEEPIAIEKIVLKGSEKLYTYSELCESYEKNGYRNYDGETVYIEAEEAYRKSDYSLRAQSDKTDANTQPFSATQIRYNCIGGNSWKYQSQWISWKIDVPSDGLYKIGLRFKQDIIKGFFSSRRLYIDGAVPFEEANNLKFAYSEDWQVAALGEDEPYLFYLTKGTHEIKLEVVTGEISEVIEGLQGIADDLMSVYRRIIAITGTSPDQYRDYNITASVTDMVDIFKQSKATLEEQLDRLSEILNEKHVNASALQTLVSQLEDIIDDPDTIVDSGRLSTFSSNVSSFSSWLLDLKYQPLTIDSIMLMNPESEMPKANASFITSLKASVLRFFYSFASRYGVEKDDGCEKITVWISSGRDQLQILNNMISDSFTPETGIKVDIRLVSASLVQAILAKDGPDVAINVARDQPVNLAIRNALVDLSQIDGFETVKEDYNPTAFDPYTYDGGCYGIPDSQVFPMMFYRTDIFEELGLECPQTWDEFSALAPILQRNNMRVGIPSAGTGMFTAFLYQSGGSFYNTSLTDTEWLSENAYYAFSNWTKYFTQYGFSLEYSFNNLFRVGEMPIGIADYNMYNTIKVTCPELEGLWEMVPLPGTADENGEIDRSVSASGTASVIFKNTDNPEAAWKFISWWTDADAQLRYATEMESVMGVSARQTPANLKALQGMNWSKTELDGIMTQIGYVRELAEIPGGYIVTRNLANAFNDTVVNGKNARASLERWADRTSTEVKRKQKEFGIE